MKNLADHHGLVVGEVVEQKHLDAILAVITASLHRNPFAVSIAYNGNAEVVEALARGIVGRGLCDYPKAHNLVNNVMRDYSREKTTYLFFNDHWDPMLDAQPNYVRLGFKLGEPYDRASRRIGFAEFVECCGLEANKYLSDKEIDYPFTVFTKNRTSQSEGILQTIVVFAFREEAEAVMFKLGLK